MQSWCIVVPRERGEDVRRRLLEVNKLAPHLRIVREGDRLFVPTTDRVDIGFPIAERDFPEGYVAVRSYKDVADVPSAVRSSLPSSFDVVGDIAVIKIPRELRGHREAIGRAILRWNPRLRVVVEDHGVKGEHRIRQIEVIAGEPRTTTRHLEHGLTYRVDLGAAYFSPRLASERLRIANATRDGEVVADPFAGVGPYAILIAKKRRPREVHASDANPVAVDLLRANISANRVDHVTVRAGDARKILRRIAPVDRVILDLPHSAFDFLPEAFAALGPGGTVHVYRILETADEDAATDAIRSGAHVAGLRITDLRRRHVRAYSPTQHHTAFDVTVVRESCPSGLETSRTAARTSPRRGTRASGTRLARTAPRSGARARRKKR